MANPRAMSAFPTPAQAPRLCSTSLIAVKAISTRRLNVRHLPKVKHCKAVKEARKDDQNQGSKPKLTYKALEKAFIQERLENLNRQRANQQLQARAAQAEANAKKAVRVLTKGARRLREQKSRVSLLETKLDRVARESDLLQLHQTIDEKEEGLQRAQEEVHAYKSKHWRSEEEKEHQAYLKRQALAAKWEAQKAAKELEAQRERDLNWFQETLDTTKVVGQFLFEMCVKALLLPSLASSSWATQEDKQNSTSKADKEEAAHFL